MSQISHFKSFLQIFIYGCYVNFIVPFHKKVIYIHHKKHNISSKFIYKQCCVIKIIMFEIQLQNMLNYLFILGTRCLSQSIQGLDELTYLVFLSFHNKSFWMRHEDILFQVSIQERIIHIHLVKFPPIMCSQIQ